MSTKMRARLAALVLIAGAPAIAGCNSLTGAVTTAAETSQAAETGGELLYVAIAEGIEAFDSLPSTTPAQVAAANGIWRKAWADLHTIRTLYAAGQSITGALNTLGADQGATESTTGVNVVPAAKAPPS